MGESIDQSSADSNDWTTSDQDTGGTSYYSSDSSEATSTGTGHDPHNMAAAESTTGYGTTDDVG